MIKGYVRRDEARRVYSSFTTTTMVWLNHMSPKRASRLPPHPPPFSLLPFPFLFAYSPFSLQDLNETLVPWKIKKYLPLYLLPIGHCPLFPVVSTFVLLLREGETPSSPFFSLPSFPPFHCRMWRATVCSFSACGVGEVEMRQFGTECDYRRREEKRRQEVEEHLSSPSFSRMIHMQRNVYSSYRYYV